MIRVIAITILAFSGSSLAVQPQTDRQTTAAKNFMVNTISVVRNEPDGTIIGIWNKRMRFTSNEQQGDWIRISGHFPDGKWLPLERETWISKFYVDQQRVKTPVKRSNRPNGISRYIKVNKSNFKLQVVERKDGQEKTIFTTRVALGMDRCLPESRGGRCYYTPSGNYQIKRKFSNADGIVWCIPKKMEAEYPYKITDENRCKRGPFGKHALNIGGSYAIHGTDRPDLIGKKVSHGCVRAANQDMAKIYNMMDVGDKVIIIN